MKRTVAVLACIMLFAIVSSAHGDEQHVVGTISKLSQSSVTVQTTAKESVEVMITSDTKFAKGSAAATAKDLQVGERVVIHAMPMKGGMLMAHTVQIGVARSR